MLQFKEISLSDKQWIRSLLEMSDFRSEEYNFTFMYIWRHVFHYRAAQMNQHLILKAAWAGRPPSYLYPAGCGDVAPIIEAIRADAASAGTPLVFHTVLTEQKTLLETLYPGQFSFMSVDDYFDYVYDAQSLITLSGKKLHAKRNHINRFKAENPDWTYEAITGANLPEVLQMSDDWLKRHMEDATRSLEQESLSVYAAIRDFCALGMDGGLLRVNGRIVAFSMGDRLNSDTYLVHIEKAYSDIHGAYAMINQQFAEHNCQGYRYINREDDSGQEGLRKAKQSYRPAFLVEKFGARWTGA
jgi:Uncharacterized conserved protein